MIIWPVAFGLRDEAVKSAWDWTRAGSLGPNVDVPWNANGSQIE